MIDRIRPREIVYKYRYPKEAIRRFNELKKDEEFLRRHELLERNIDYRTGEKVVYFSDQWHELVKEFIIRCDESDCRVINSVYFKEVENIDYEDYLKECDEIDRKNILMKNRNDKILEAVEEIDNLKYWNDYIVFYGYKYGIPKIFNEIHRKNDCFGNVKQCDMYYDHFVCDKCNKVV